MATVAFRSGSPTGCRRRAARRRSPPGGAGYRMQPKVGPAAMPASLSVPYVLSAQPFWQAGRPKSFRSNWLFPCAVLDTRILPTELAATSIPTSVLRLAMFFSTRLPLLVNSRTMPSALLPAVLPVRVLLLAFTRTMPRRLLLAVLPVRVLLLLVLKRRMPVSWLLL